VTQNVKVTGEFWWEALNEFFNNEKNLNVIQHAAASEIPPMKEFTASLLVEIIEDVESGIPDDMRYVIVAPVEFNITGDYKFSGEDYTEESH